MAENLKNGETEKEEPPAAPPKPSVRTMVGDVQEYLKDKKISLAELLAQRSKKETETYEESQFNKFRPAIYGAAVILILTLAGFGAFWIRKTLNQPTITKPAAPALFIPAKEEKIIEIAGSDLNLFLNQWKDAFKTKLLPREFAAIHIFDGEQNKFLEAADFFRLIKAPLPPFLSNGLDGEMNLGIMDTPRGTEPVFIFRLKSYSEAFAGMLAWEKNLPKAMADLLSDEITLDRADNNFQDSVIANHDARLVKNAKNEIIFLYAVFNRRILILAQSPAALETIIKQLALFIQQ